MAFGVAVTPSSVPVRRYPTAGCSASASLLGPHVCLHSVVVLVVVLILVPVKLASFLALG